MKRILPPLMILLPLLVSQAQTNQVNSFDPAWLSDRGQKAYRLLMEGEVFGIGGVGLSPQPSSQEMAFYVLMKEEAAAEAFMSLVEHARPEGALYGLYGLRLKGNAALERAAKLLNELEGPSARKIQPFGGEMMFGTGEGQVLIYEGCAIAPADKQRMVEMISSGAYDSRSREGAMR